MQSALDDLKAQGEVKVYIGRYGTLAEVDRQIELDNQIPDVSTLAGSGNASDGNAQGSAAHLSYPCGIAADSSGIVYVTEHGNHRIRKVFPDGVVVTLAGRSGGRLGILRAVLYLMARECCM